MGNVRRETGELLGRVVLSRFTDVGICNDTDEEFAAKVAAVVDRVVSLNPGLRISGNLLNAFGFGHIPEVLKSDGGEGFFFGHDLAAALNWDPAEFDKLMRVQESFDLREQRDSDVETGKVGWECIRYWPMRVSVWTGEGRSDEHYDESGCMRGPINRYWTDVWLINTDRLMNLMMLSPWGKEFFEAARPMMAFGFGKVFGDKAKEVKTFSRRENSLGEVEVVETGGTLADMFAEEREGLTEQQAIDRAMRGPSLPTDLGGDAA